MKGLVEMNTSTTKEKVTEKTSHVRPIVERALRDEELRQNVKDAYTSARALYDQLVTKNDVSHVATKLVSDEEVQAQLRNVVEQIRSAAGRAQTAQKQAQKAQRSARTTVLLVAGIAIGLLFAKRKLFGRNKGFVYHDGNGTHLS
jgi:hypothetical protein